MRIYVRKDVRLSMTLHKHNTPQYARPYLHRQYDPLVFVLYVFSRVVVSSKA